MNVIPITPEGNVVFIHQFRHGTETVEMEIPGGLVDPGEPPEETARRELLEETGYAADEIIHIGTVKPNPAFLDNTCYSYLALGARKVQEPEFDSAEDIVVEELPLDDVGGLIRNGRITHSLVVAAFYHLTNYNKS
ncbi:MAG: NUDIX hydrolase [Chloroflexi bacterium]|nr:NUDIX hydrolase [Chloroflexota bacterium]